MFRKTACFTIAGLTVLGTVSETAAGGRAVECYEPVRTPAVYDTVYEDVLVSPPGQQVRLCPAIYGTRERVVQIAFRHSVTYEIVPAITRTIYRTVQVDDGGYSWEWRIIHGRKVLCKIWHKARYERVAETVVIQPERTRRVVIPAAIRQHRRGGSGAAGTKAHHRHSAPPTRRWRAGWWSGKAHPAGGACIFRGTARTRSGDAQATSARSHFFRPATSPSPTAAATRLPTAAPNL